MIDKSAFKTMRTKIERFDSMREDLIKTSRLILKFSKSAIYEIHRNKLADANKLLNNARKSISQINQMISKDSRLSTVGAYNEALEEFVEASCYYGFMNNKKIPTAKQLGVDEHIYIPGLCDLVGELVRKAINSSIKDDYKTAIKIKDFVSEIYAELMMFNFRNTPARRKFDSIKYGLEKLENLILSLKLKDKIK